MGKTEPWRRLVGMIGDAVQLSVAVGAGKLSAVPKSMVFSGKAATTFAGQAMTGGAVSGVTVILSVASANSPPLSVTRKVKPAFEAPQAVETSAETWPEASTLIELTVTPLIVALAASLTVTVRMFRASSASLTWAMVELEAGRSCVRDTLAAIITGGVLVGAVYT